MMTLDVTARNVGCRSLTVEPTPSRLAEVGDWIIDCGTEAEFLARAERSRDR